MSSYFNISDFRVCEFDRTEPRFVEQIPGLPAQLASGCDWRRLSDTNLVWLEKTLQNACQRPCQCEERLGLGVIFFFHLRAVLHKEFLDDLRADLFGDPNGGFEF